MKFNRLAVKSGKLHSLLKEGEYPFYVDRVAGGIGWYGYKFDPELIREYADLLGDWFLGFQLHESVSNRRFVDWALIESVSQSKGPYDCAMIKERLLHKKRTEALGIPMYNLNMDPPEAYHGKVFPETPGEMIEDMKDMFRRRMAEVEGHILPADSAFAALKLENELG